MGDLREPNGVVLEESPVTSSSSRSSSSSLGAAAYVGREVWAGAEAATREIIQQVQPTVVSEDRRRNVIDYVQRLLKRCLGCEVFPFGSVPLKTYLPDGDIDLTAFCGLNFEEAFANDVYSVLQAEDRNPHAEFVVKDVQYIRAEVKLVKCLVQNIVVDISFNQIGGLCALCFLEEVDRLIGKDHLFKRSIILIKAWCYYESRILGAHHGLISTYALETLVLFIFHLFHSSLNGPLAVLHKFLDFFSKFDWDSFCVSLSGPVILASLPEIVVDIPDSSGGDLLLSDTFMRECVRKFSVPSKGPEMNYRTFIQKHLNIVDPLKENNNLGRSVSKGNFFRIRSAVSYGARKLGHILGQPQEHIAEEVRKFFTNTLDRHGKGLRPDVQDHPLLATCNGFPPEMSVSLVEPCQDQMYTHDEDSIYSNNHSSEGSVGSEDKKEAVASESNLEGIVLEDIRGVKKSSPRTLSVVELPTNELSASASRLSGDANERTTYGVQDLRKTEQGDDICSSVTEDGKLPLGYSPHVPPLHSTRPLENGLIENGHFHEEQHTDSLLNSSKTVAGHSHQNGFISWEHDNSRLCNNHDHLYSRHSSVDGESGCSQGSHFMYQSTKLLPDLSGDVDCHLDNLQYGRWWYDQGLTMLIQPIHLIPPPLFPSKHPWEGIHQSVQLRHEMVPQMNVNGVVPRPGFYPSNPQVAQFVDEMPKARGIGTYFPTTNHHSYRDRPSPKGRYQGQLRSPRTNGRGLTPPDRSPQLQSPVRQGLGRPKFSDNQESSPRGKVYKEANGFVHASEMPSEYGSSRLPPLEVALPESEICRPPDSDPSPGSQHVEPVFVLDESRLSLKYQLKDEDDFPPLSA